MKTCKFCGSANNDLNLSCTNCGMPFENDEPVAPKVEPTVQPQEVIIEQPAPEAAAPTAAYEQPQSNAETAPVAYNKAEQFESMKVMQLIKERDELKQKNEILQELLLAVTGARGQNAKAEAQPEPKAEEVKTKTAEQIKDEVMAEIFAEQAKEPKKEPAPAAEEPKTDNVQGSVFEESDADDYSDDGLYRDFIDADSVNEENIFDKVNGSTDEAKKGEDFFDLEAGLAAEQHDVYDPYQTKGAKRHKKVIKKAKPVKMQKVKMHNAGGAKASGAKAFFGVVSMLMSLACVGLLFISLVRVGGATEVSGWNFIASLFNKGGAPYDAYLSYSGVLTGFFATINKYIVYIFVGFVALNLLNLIVVGFTFTRGAALRALNIIFNALQLMAFLVIALLFFKVAGSFGELNVIVYVIAGLSLLKLLIHSFLYKAA